MVIVIETNLLMDDGSPNTSMNGIPDSELVRISTSRLIVSQAVAWTVDEVFYGSHFGLPDGVPVDGLDGIFVLTINCVVDEVSDSACEGASDGDKSDCTLDVVSCGLYSLL